MRVPISKRRRDWSGWLLYLFMTVFGIVMLAPLVYMVSTAFKPLEELFLFPPRFFVMRPTMENFYTLLFITNASTVPFSRYIFNSVVATTGIVLGGILISAMAAYPLSKHAMPFRKSIFSLIVLALMFTSLVTQIPQYLVINKLGLLNTYWALIIPYLASPLGLFLMKQFLDQIPDTLLEAAKIDGASEWKIFRTVVVPLLKPATATMALFSFVGAWNDQWPSTVYITQDDLRTLPYALSTILGTSGTIARVGTTGAASLIMVLPTIAVFVITQRMVLETMAHSGLKE